jgi:hypothetical protein
MLISITSNCNSNYNYNDERKKKYGLKKWFHTPTQAIRLMVGFEHKLCLKYTLMKILITIDVHNKLCLVVIFCITSNRKRPHFNEESSVQGW